MPKPSFHVDILWAIKDKGINYLNESVEELRDANNGKRPKNAAVLTAIKAKRKAKWPKIARAARAGQPDKPGKPDKEPKEGKAKAKGSKYD